MRYVISEQLGTRDAAQEIRRVMEDYTRKGRAPKIIGMLPLEVAGKPVDTAHNVEILRVTQFLLFLEVEDDNRPRSDF